MRLPGIERVRRFQDRAVALDGLDLAGDRRHDPVADLVEHHEGVVEFVVEHFRPHDAGAARLDELDRDGETCVPPLQRPAHHVIDIEHAAGFLGADAALVQGEYRALRDDEQGAQLGKPRDDVVGERVGGAATRDGVTPVDERHHRDGGAAAG
jgi:hypothetical protein